MCETFSKVPAAIGILMLVLLISPGHMSSVAATDEQHRPDQVSQPINAHPHIRQNMQAIFLKLQRGYISCIPDTALQADLDELKRRVAKVGIKEKLAAAEFLLRSGDKEDIAAGLGLLHDVNDSLQGRRIQIQEGSNEDHK